jgi:hypothetical protein
MEVPLCSGALSSCGDNVTLGQNQALSHAAICQGPTAIIGLYSTLIRPRNAYRATSSCFLSTLTAHTQFPGHSEIALRSTPWHRRHVVLSTMQSVVAETTTAVKVDGSVKLDRVARRRQAISRVPGHSLHCLPPWHIRSAPAGSKGPSARRK